MDIKYKIVYGYSAEKEITISNGELEKSYKLFLYGGRAVFDNGEAVDSKYIQAIQPDWHATMGWNKTYKLAEDDFSELRQKGIDRKANDEMYLAKTKVYETFNQKEIPKIESSI